MDVAKHLVSGTSADAHASHGSARVPGLRAVDHVAFTVPDLDRALHLFTEGLGGELVYRLPPLSRNDDWMAEHLDVHPRAVAEIALVRLGPYSNLELFQYTAPDHNAVPPRAGRQGCLSLGLRVADPDATAARLAGFAEVRPADPGALSGSCGPADGRQLAYHTAWGGLLTLRRPPERTAGLWRGTASEAAGLDRVAYSVADLDGAVAFFTGVLGAVPLHHAPRTAGGTVLLRLGATCTVELAPCDASSPPPARNHDVGGNHLAFFADDVDAAAEHLARTPGVRLLGAPETVMDGVIDGDRWVYVRTPAGICMEIVHMPDGRLPYERHTTARRFSAAGLEWDAPLV